MHLLHTSGLSLGCCLLASIALAQVPSDAIRQGTVLDAPGIQLSSFGRPMPLPPGRWEVVSRTDSEIKLTGEGPRMAPKVSLTVHNTDGTAPLAAMVLSYTPDAIQIRWSGYAKCEDAKANLVDDFGTTTGSLTYACSVSYVNPAGFKKFVASAPLHANAWVKTHVSPLAPFVADMPDKSIWSTLQLNRDRGRSLEFAFIARAHPAALPGDPLTPAERDWIQSTGRAYIDFLQGNASTIGAFPVAVVTSAQ
jgi:hypothetical protein